MPGGAPKGNKNASSKPFHEAIQRALKKRSRVDQAEALLKVANELIDKAESGDMDAIKVLADRVDGRPAQSINVGGQPDNPIQTEHEHRWAVEPVAANPHPREISSDTDDV